MSEVGVTVDETSIAFHSNYVCSRVGQRARSSRAVRRQEVAPCLPGNGQGKQTDNNIFRRRFDDLCLLEGGST
jgi:hypothetical protein